MDNINIKIMVRFTILAFLLYLSNKIISEEWLLAVTTMDPMVHSSIYVSVFGALTLVIKYHYETKPGE